MDRTPRHRTTLVGDSDRGRAAYVALATTPGIGPARMATLLQATGSALGAITAPFALLCSLPGISRAAATAIRQASVDRGHSILTRLSQLGGDTLLPDDARFPAALTTIPDPPVLLFAQGDLSLLESPAAALVGSRDHSAYGAEICRELARGAARAGLTVVSGMARGLDAVAHQAALDAGGGTIGVLGNGLGVVYPAANRSLYERVCQVGLLLSEFPPGERPHAGSFPRRNRLISGLARVTVVIEAGERSGTLITVAAALDQGRDVMAVPGPITSLTSVGTNRLIRDGAAPLLEPADLLTWFDGLAAPANPQEETRSPPLAPDSQRVYDQLDGAPMHLDALAERLSEPVGRLLAILSALELEGLVEQQPGGGHLFGRVS